MQSFQFKDSSFHIFTIITIIIIIIQEIHLIINTISIERIQFPLCLPVFFNRIGINTNMWIIGNMQITWIIEGTSPSPPTLPACFLQSNMNQYKYANYWDKMQIIWLIEGIFPSAPTLAACFLQSNMNQYNIWIIWYIQYNIWIIGRMQIIWLIEGTSPSPPPLPAPRYHNLVGALDLRPHSYQGEGPQH